MSANGPQSSQRLSALDNFGYFAAGVLIVVLPLIWVVLFISSTIVIANSPISLWYTQIWLLLGATWLLFWRKAKPQTRKIVEVSIWIATVALLVAVGIPRQHENIGLTCQFSGHSPAKRVRAADFRR